MVSQHALQVVSQLALQQVSRGVVSQHVLQVSRPTPKGESEGDLVRGCLLQGVPALGMPALGGCLPLEGVWRPPVTATAVVGTHPTGMHSC